MGSCYYLPYQDPLEHGLRHGWSVHHPGPGHLIGSPTVLPSVREGPPRRRNTLLRAGANAPESPCHSQVHGHEATGTRRPPGRMPSHAGLNGNRKPAKDREGTPPEVQGELGLDPGGRIRGGNWKGEGQKGGRPSPLALRDHRCSD